MTLTCHTHNTTWQEEGRPHCPTHVVVSCCLGDLLLGRGIFFYLNLWIQKFRQISDTTNDENNAYTEVDLKSHQTQYLVRQPKAAIQPMAKKRLACLPPQS